MPAPGVVLLIAAALLVSALVIGLGIIASLLVRISGALAQASDDLGRVPDQLAPVGPAVSTYTAATSELRETFTGRGVNSDG